MTFYGQRKHTAPKGGVSFSEIAQAAEMGVWFGAAFSYFASLQFPAGLAGATIYDFGGSYFFP